MLSSTAPAPSKQVLDSADYCMDLTLPAGPVFDLKYNGGLFFDIYHNEADTHQMGTHTHIRLHRLRQTTLYITCKYSC